MKTKTILLFQAMMFPLSGFARQKESSVDKPVAGWPKIALINQPMKNKYVVVLTLLFCLINTTMARQQPAGKPIVYKLDLNMSKLFWKATKVNGGHNGFLLFNSGVLNADAKGKLRNGNFVMNMTSITAVDKLLPRENRESEQVIKAGNFFATAQYPTATINVKSIVATGKVNQYQVTGDLTIKGVTKPLVFVATISPNGSGLKAEAEMDIDRTKWGITYKSGNFFSDLKDELISDMIHISLNLVFYKG